MVFMPLMMARIGMICSKVAECQKMRRIAMDASKIETGVISPLKGGRSNLNTF